MYLTREEVKKMGKRWRPYWRACDGCGKYPLQTNYESYFFFSIQTCDNCYSNDRLIHKIRTKKVIRTFGIVGVIIWLYLIIKMIFT